MTKSSRRSGGWTSRRAGSNVMRPGRRSKRIGPRSSLPRTTLAAAAYSAGSRLPSKRQDSLLVTAKDRRRSAFVQGLADAGRQLSFPERLAQQYDVRIQLRFLAKGGLRETRHID